LFRKTLEILGGSGGSLSQPSIRLRFTAGKRGSKEGFYRKKAGEPLDSGLPGLTLRSFTDPVNLIMARGERPWTAPPGAGGTALREEDNPKPAAPSWNRGGTVPQGLWRGG